MRTPKTAMHKPSFAIGRARKSATKVGVFSTMACHGSTLESVCSGERRLRRVSAWTFDLNYSNWEGVRGCEEMGGGIRTCPNHPALAPRGQS